MKHLAVLENVVRQYRNFEPKFFSFLKRGLAEDFLKGVKVNIFFYSCFVLLHSRATVMQRAPVVRRCPLSVRP